MRIGLVGCVKGKGPVPAPAADLYVSPLFVGRRRFVELSCDRWFILSALHGLLEPEEVVAPYDRSLVEASTGERRSWTERVLASLDQTLGDIQGIVFEIHAGAAYREYGLIDGLRRRGAVVEVPAAGLSQGRQLAFYSQPPGAPVADSPAAAARSTSGASPKRAAASGGAYQAWSDLLAASDADRVVVAFGEVEAVLGRKLPASARRHRPWWGNHEGSPQALAWLGAGWRVAAVDLAGEQVTFERARP